MRKSCGNCRRHNSLASRVHYSRRRYNATAHPEGANRTAPTACGECKYCIGYRKYGKLEQYLASQPSEMATVLVAVFPTPDDTSYFAGKKTNLKQLNKTRRFTILRQFTEFGQTKTCWVRIIWDGTATDEHRNDATKRVRKSGGKKANAFVVRVEQAEQDPWLQRRKRGGKNSRRPIPSEDVNSTGAFRSIPPVPLDTQRTAFEQREAVAQVQDALGVPSKQIAQELGVSEATVQRYLRTPEQRAESAAKAQRQLHAAETARQAAAQRHELERAERVQRHQVRLSARPLYDTGLTADEAAEVLGITPFQAGKFTMESGVRQRALRWKNIPPEEMERRQRAADHKRKRKQRRDNRQQAAGKKAK